MNLEERRFRLIGFGLPDDENAGKPRCRVDKALPAV